MQSKMIRALLISFHSHTHTHIQKAPSTVLNVSKQWWNEWRCATRYRCQREKVGTYNFLLFLLPLPPSSLLYRLHIFHTLWKRIGNSYHHTFNKYEQLTEQKHTFFFVSNKITQLSTDEQSTTMHELCVCILCSTVRRI